MFKPISKIMIYKKRNILEKNMVSVKAAKKYFDFLLYLSFKKGYTQNKRQKYMRQEERSNNFKDSRRWCMCVKDYGKIGPNKSFGTCIKDEKLPHDTECKENEKKTWKLSSYIKVVRKYAQKYKHQF